MIAVLPTNRDENWRYANLRPLAKATRRRRACSRWRTAQRSPCRAAAARLSSAGCSSTADSPRCCPHPRRDACATLLNARDAGEEFAADARCGPSPPKARTSRWRASMARAATRCCTIAPPDDAPAAEHRAAYSSRSAGGRRRHLVSARAGASPGRSAHLRIVERHLSAGSDADSVVNAAVDLALRTGADHRSLPRCRICADAASGFDTLIAHVGERATYRLRTVTLGGLDLALHHLHQARGPRRALRPAPRRSIANGIQTHDVFAEIEHVARRHRDARVVSRHRHRPRQARLQRQDDRARVRARRRLRPVAEVAAHRHRRGSLGAPAARDLHRPRARQARRHHRQARRADAVLPAVARHRPAHRADAAAVGLHRGCDVTHGLPASARAKSKRLVAAQLNEVSALEGLLGKP